MIKESNNLDFQVATLNVIKESLIDNQISNYSEIVKSTKIPDIDKILSDTALNMH